MPDNFVRETKLDLYVNQDSPLTVNINFEGKEYSIRRNGKGLKISCIKGLRVDMPDIHQGEWLIVE